VSGPDKHYGLGVRPLDSDEDKDDDDPPEAPDDLLQLEAKKENILENLRARWLKMIQCNDFHIRVTQGTKEWVEERLRLLTASWFGAVCKRKSTTSCAVLVRSMLYS
jgi:hypothetical protein